MSETIQIALISASFAALINCIFQMLNKLLDNAKETKQYNRVVKDEYKEKKEQVYIACIGKLLQIRYGFDFTREDLSHSSIVKETFNKKNIEFIDIAPKLRLYSTDKIFNRYMELGSFVKYSFAPSNGRRLIENSKWAYEAQITLLSRLMQEDLGYRKYSENHDTILCPDCATEHDMVTKCPTCKMTFEELQKKIQQALEQTQEIQEENNDTDKTMTDDNSQQT